MPGLLNHQIANQVFDCITDGGPLVVITDGQGNCWPSDGDRHAAIFAQNHSLDHIIGRIDDGDDPVINDVNGVAVIGSQLEVSEGHRIYVIISFEKHTNESLVRNIELVEMIVSLMNVAGQLIDANNRLKHQKSKYPGITRAADFISMN